MNAIAISRHLRIEVDRCRGWELRSEGDVGAGDVTPEVLRDQLRSYALQYPHRAIVDGEVVMTMQPRTKRRS
jgi:hypothetical protein